MINEMHNGKLAPSEDLATRKKVFCWEAGDQLIGHQSVSWFWQPARPCAHPSAPRAMNQFKRAANGGHACALHARATFTERKKSIAKGLHISHFYLFTLINTWVKKVLFQQTSWKMIRSKRNSTRAKAQCCLQRCFVITIRILAHCSTRPKDWLYQSSGPLATPINNSFPTYHAPIS